MKKGSNFTRYANLPVRLLVGFGFIEHGFAKLSRGPGPFAGLEQLGVPLPHLVAWLTSGTEILGIDLLYLATLLMLARQGPGPLAFDNVRQGRKIRTVSREKRKALCAMQSLGKHIPLQGVRRICFVKA